MIAIDDQDKINHSWAIEEDFIHRIRLRCLIRRILLECKVNGEIEKGFAIRIKAEWSKWRSAYRVLRDFFSFLFVF